MGIAIGNVNSADTTGAGNHTLTYPGSCSSTSTLIAIARSGGASTNTLSDPTNGTWSTNAAIPTTGFADIGGDTLYFAFFQNNASGSALTVTLNQSAATSLRWAIAEITGCATTSVLDGIAVQQQNGVIHPASANITTTNANDLFVAFFEAGTAGAAVGENFAGSNPATGWINLFNVATGKLVVSYQVVSATQTNANETWDCSAGGTDNFATSTVAFKQGSGAPPPATPSFGGFSDPIVTSTRMVACKTGWRRPYPGSIIRRDPIVVPQRTC